MEAGYVVEEEGISPIFLNVPLAEDLQTMINRWSSQTPVRALVAAEQFVFLALPRYAGDGKNSSPIRLQEMLSLPAFEGPGTPSGFELGWSISGRSPPQGTTAVSSELKHNGI